MDDVWKSLMRETNGCIYVEDPLRNTINGYIESIACGEVSLMCAVHRGRISEGIDFSDNLARAVISIGIPFPSTQQEDVHLKMKFNDARQPQLLDGRHWYQIQAKRAVNQAVHLGNGVLVRADKMAYIMGARGDSMFVKEAAKLVFGRESLQMRSVTGKPCLRFKKAIAKRAPTHAKVKIVRMMASRRYQPGDRLLGREPRDARKRWESDGYEYDIFPQLPPPEAHPPKRWRYQEQDSPSLLSEASWEAEDASRRPSQPKQASFW
ncbi:hypothetical protein ISCGN_026978 [Ixodes scapularis]